MPTKDPHVALIDAHEELAQIKAQVRTAVDLVKHRAANGLLTSDDKLIIKAIKAEAIDAARRVQDRLHEELEGHTRQGGNI